MKSNDQQQMEQDFPAKQENGLIEDENDSLFLIIFFRLINLNL